MGTNLQSLAAAYLRRGRNDATQQRAFDKVVDMINADTEEAWRFTLCAIERSKTDADLAGVAAGVLEELLKNHGPQFIDRVEEEARKNPKLLLALSGAWMDDSDPVFSRWLGIMEKYGFTTGRRKRL